MIISKRKTIFLKLISHRLHRFTQKPFFREIWFASRTDITDLDVKKSVVICAICESFLYLCKNLQEDDSFDDRLRQSRADF